MFDTMGFENNSKISRTKESMEVQWQTTKNLSFYTNNFELDMLAHTKSYYTEKTTRMIKSLSCKEYIDYVDDLYEKE